MNNAEQIIYEVQAGNTTLEWTPFASEAKEVFENTEPPRNVECTVFQISGQRRYPLVKRNHRGDAVILDTERFKGGWHSLVRCIRPPKTTKQKLNAPQYRARNSNVLLKVEQFSRRQPRS